MSRAGRARVAGLVAALALLAILALTPASAGAAIPIAVNDTRDRPDRSIGDGVCATVGGTCTLRAAVQEANALLGQDTINLGPGVYELEIPVVNEDTQSTGDHDIVDTVNIVGTGAGATFIDGGFPLPDQPVEAHGIDRLFEIHPSAGNVTFRSLSIRDGYSEEGGGGIQNWSPGLLRLENVHLLHNLASKSGGGLNNDDPFAYEWPTGFAAAHGHHPQRPGRDHRLQARRQLRRQRRRRREQRLERDHHDHRQRGRGQPGPDDPGSGAVHRPVRPRAGRVHPRARAYTSPP